MRGLDTSGLHLASEGGPRELSLEPGRGQLQHVGLQVFSIEAGAQLALERADMERLVVPLAGACSVRCAGGEEELRGRVDVFSGPTDFAYVPVGESAVIIADGPIRVALPAAVAEASFPFRVMRAEGVPIEVRGAGPAQRVVRNFCAVDVFEADRLISVEVITPGGNWSSYPPHKHDVETEDECALEEIYYFQISQGSGREGFGYQRVYAVSDPPIDLLVEVRDRDAVLIPYGYHGPSMAAPGYDMYYLNAMAGGSDVRRWAFTDDPDHAWVRDTWAAE